MRGYMYGKLTIRCAHVRRGNPTDEKEDAWLPTHANRSLDHTKTFQSCLNTYSDIPCWGIYTIEETGFTEVPVKIEDNCMAASLYFDICFDRFCKGLRVSLCAWNLSCRLEHVSCGFLSNQRSSKIWSKRLTITRKYCISSFISWLIWLSMTGLKNWI